MSHDYQAIVQDLLPPVPAAARAMFFIQNTVLASTTVYLHTAFLPSGTILRAYRHYVQGDRVIANLQQLRLAVGESEADTAAAWNNSQIIMPAFGAASGFFYIPADPADDAPWRWVNIILAIGPTRLQIELLNNDASARLNSFEFILDLAVARRFQDGSR